MTAAEILHQAAEAGLHLRAEGDRLIVEGSDAALRSGLIEVLRKHKPGLLEALSATGDGTGGAPLGDLPLAAKLRAYGEPFPLMVGDRVAAWLASDDEAARSCEKPEPIYTADEVKVVAELSPEEAQRLHRLKAKLGGRITLDRVHEEAQ